MVLYKKPIPKDEICNECGSDLTFEKRQDLLKIKTNKGMNLEKIIAEDTEVLNKLLLDKADIENLILKQNQRIEKNNKLTAEISSIDLEIPYYSQDVELQTQLLASSIQDIEVKEKQIVEVCNNIKEIKNKLLSINQKDIENKIIAIDREISIIENDIKQQRTTLSNFTLELGQAQAILLIKERELLSLQEFELEKKKLEKQLLLYKAGLNCFSSNGIPAMIIHSILNSLQNEANKLFDKIKPKLQLKFIISKENDKGIKSDTLDIIYYKGGVEHDFADLSGGEQALSVLVLKLAMAHINRNRNNVDIDILLFDESDAALDALSVDKFFDVIKEMSAQMTILVVTHNNNLKDKFKSQILVKSENSISQIEIFNNGNFSN